MHPMQRTIPAILLALFLPAVLAGERDKSDSTKSKLTVGTKVGQRIPSFKAGLLDVRGKQPKETAFDSHVNAKPTAYVFMSRTCPYCHQYQKRLAEMSKAYGKRGLQFIMVYPTRRTPAEQKVAYHKKAAFQAPMINDKDASIAKLLRITKTPEIVLVAKDGKIVFRGGIDDNPRDADSVKKPYLKTACNDLVAGRKVSVTSAPLYG